LEIYLVGNTTNSHFSVSNYKIDTMRLRMFSLFLAGASFFLACEQNSSKEESSDTDPVCSMRVKVIYNFCSYVFLQVLDEQHYSLADDQWRSSDGRVYSHIFMLNNFCELGQSLTEKKLWESEFKVTVVDDEYVNECATCLAAYAGKLPESKLAVRLCTGDEPQN
jgi:hypothetical protein